LAAGRIRELVPSEVRPLQGSPPVLAHANSRRTSQLSGRVSATRVHRADRHTAASFLHRPPQVAVVADHDRSVEAASEYVDEQVRGDVDVAPLLL